MPTINTETEVSVDVLIKAAEQLKPAELRRLTAEMLTLSAKRNAPSLSKNESALLLKINQRLPVDVQNRYDELIAKREAETLTPDEYSELLDLTRQAEAFDYQRLETMTELAKIRGITLSALLKELQIEPG
jgi:hypothetical protein